MTQMMMILGLRGILTWAAIVEAGGTNESREALVVEDQQALAPLKILARDKRKASAHAPDCFLKMRKRNLEEEDDEEEEEDDIREDVELADDDYDDGEHVMLDEMTTVSSLLERFISYFALCVVCFFFPSMAMPGLVFYDLDYLMVYA